MHAGPGGGERRALVAVAFHAFVILDEDHVQVLSEVFEGVPFLFELLNPAEVSNAGEFGRDGTNCRFLLGAVDDEFPADHGDVRIDFRLILISGAFGMKRVGCRVESDETFAVNDSLQKLVLAFGGHGGRLCFVRLGKDAAGVKGDSIVLIEIAIEDPAVFRADDLEAVAFAQFGEDSIGDTGLAVLDFDGLVLKTGRAREVKDLLLFFFSGGDPMQRKSRSGEYGGAGCSKHVATVHISSTELGMIDCLG